MSVMDRNSEVLKPGAPPARNFVLKRLAGHQIAVVFKERDDLDRQLSGEMGVTSAREREAFIRRTERAGPMPPPRLRQGVAASRASMAWATSLLQSR